MAEEVKNDLQDDSGKVAESVAEDNSPAATEQPPQGAEGNETEAGPAPSDVKPIDPEDQTFWKDSVDANSVDLSDGEPPQQEPATEDGTGSAPTTPSTHKEEAQGEGEDQPPAQEPVAEKDAGPDEPPKAEESPAGETEPAEDTSPAEEVNQEAGKQETSSANTEEPGSAPTTPSTHKEEAQGEGEDKPPKQEETQKREEETGAESEESRGRGKVINFYTYLRKKRLLTGIGILLLLAGSIGYTVAPGLRSTGTITLLGGAPETAYSMKFFLPLNVGYEKAQFVKVTIALELMDDGVQKELDKNLPLVRKEVIDLIIAKSPKEVRSANGKKELSREITRRINNYLSKDCIKDTYFTELVIL